MDKPSFLYLSREDVEKAGPSMDVVIDAVETGFRELGNGNVEMPPKPGIHPGEGGDSFLHAMPAYVPAMDSCGIKWVSAYPGNPKKGLPYIMGVLIYNDPETGMIRSIMDCTWITGMRTGAASAVSAKYLARPESSVIGILGCGVQGHTNLEAMSVIFPLKKLKAFDVSAEQAKKLCTFAEEKLGLSAEVADTPETAVRDSDIVVTAGPIMKTPHETIREDWLSPGTFISCVDFDSYFSRNAIARAAKWTTDNLAQYLQYRDQVGYFKNCPEVYAELGELVTGKKKGREAAEEINFAANLGLAMEDMAVAPRVFERAKQQGVGTWLPL